MDLFCKIENIALLEAAEHFELFRAISNAVNSNDSEMQNTGRNHLIKIVDLAQNIFMKDARPEPLFDLRIRVCPTAQTYFSCKLQRPAGRTGLRRAHSRK